MSSKVKIEVNPWYLVNGVPRRLEFISWFKHVDEISVVENANIPPLAIVVNRRVIGLVDPFDEPGMSSPSDHGSSSDRVEHLKPRLIFKYQFRRGVNYPAGTVSAGYPCKEELTCPADLATRARSTAITARMRVNQDYHWAANTHWMQARSRIVYQAQLLGRLGLTTKWGLADSRQYNAELWDTEIGFDWRGAGFLTHRIIEYIRAGVVPITRAFGDEWPVREDVILKDGVHAIFCHDPCDFAREASKLLLDRAKIARMRRNLLDLWRDKLSPAAQGQWLWNKLKSVM